MRISEWSSDVCSSDLRSPSWRSRRKSGFRAACPYSFVGDVPMLSLAPSPYLGAGGGGDKGFGVGIALVDLKIEDRRKAEPDHIGDEQPRRGLADRRKGEGGRDRHHQDEDDEVKRGRHLMLAEEDRKSVV